MKSAVLVIDVQSAIFDSEPKPFEAELVIGRINHVIEQAKENDVPVIFIQHEMPEYLEYNSERWQLQSHPLCQDSCHPL